MQAIHIRALRHSAFYSPLLLNLCGGYLQQEGLTPVCDVAGDGDTAFRAGGLVVCVPYPRGWKPSWRKHFARLPAGPSGGHVPAG